MNQSTTKRFGDTRCHLAPREEFGAGLVATTAAVMGRVTLSADSSVWYGAVLRGDDDSIELGARSNVQDNSVVHPLEGMPTRIGDDVTIGHGAIVHCETIGDRCLIGMGAILLGGARIGAECIIGAGTLVKENAVIPPRSLVVGSPHRVVRAVTDDEVAKILASAREYVTKAASHRIAERSVEPGARADHV
jgi:carbonic anhydrase/acetyltransferase-like protein (isoleucine patch superfamily)